MPHVQYKFLFGMSVTWLQDQANQEASWGWRVHQIAGNTDGWFVVLIKEEGK